MRVLVKKDDLYLKVAWITRMKNGSLIGWNLHNEEYIKNFPIGIESFEIHYHIPVKGKFHYSYKYIINDFKYEIRAYKDHLDTKIWGNIHAISTQDVFLPDFRNFSEFFLIDAAEEIDLHDHALVKQISSVGFNIWTDRMLNDVKNFGLKIKPKDTDIVLDIDTLGKVGLSYMVIIYNDREQISFKSFDNLQHMRISDYTAKPAIELIAVISPVDDPIN